MLQWSVHSIHSMLNMSSKYCPLWFPQYFNDTIIFYHKSRSRTNQKYIKWLPNLSCPNSKLSATRWSIFENCFDFQLLFPWHHFYLVTNHFWIIWVIKKSWISSNGCFILKKQPNFSVIYLLHVYALNAMNAHSLDLLLIIYGPMV